MDELWLGGDLVEEAPTLPLHNGVAETSADDNAAASQEGNRSASSNFAACGDSGTSSQDSSASTKPHVSPSSDELILPKGSTMSARKRRKKHTGPSATPRASGKRLCEAYNPTDSDEECILLSSPRDLRKAKRQVKRRPRTSQSRRKSQSKIQKKRQRARQSFSDDDDFQDVAPQRARHSKGRYGK